MDRDPSSSPDGRRPLLRQADQLTVAVLIAGCFLLICLHWTWHLVSGNALLEIEKAPRQDSSFEVQINRADWPELMLLPKIGETLARRIVDYRQQHGPFRSLEQLQQVDGIGPKTVRRIRPYVRLDP